MVKRRKGKRDNSKILVISLFVIALIMFLVSLYVHSLIVLSKQEVYTSLTVGNVTGFNINKTALTFGTITNVSRGSRNLTLQNEYSFPVVYVFKLRGNIKHFLIFNKYVSLQPHTKKDIKIRTIVPINESHGFYEGKFIISIKKDI